jgi:hypothetical protein
LPDGDRVNGPLTLGHVLIGVALIDLILMPLMLRSARRNPDLTPEQRRGHRSILVAVVLLSAGLCLVALLHPIGRMPIL